MLDEKIVLQMIKELAKGTDVLMKSHQKLKDKYLDSNPFEYKAAVEASMIGLGYRIAGDDLVNFFIEILYKASKAKIEETPLVEDKPDYFG